MSQAPQGLVNSASRLPQESRERPLDFALITRLWRYTPPYSTKRNALIFVALLRSLQVPLLTWIVAAVIKGPVARGDVRGVIMGTVGFALLALSTQVVVHFRQRWSLELGEAVVGDLRNLLFQHLQRMPMGWYHRTKVGRVISRMTSDIDDLRVGIQEVLLAAIVQLGQMFVAAVAMLWYDWVLFLIVLGLAPVMWLINRIFHKRLSAGLRRMRESYSQVVATLAESVVGIRVTQGFVREDENARAFRLLSGEHADNCTEVATTHGIFVPLLAFNNQLFVSLLLLVGGYRLLRPSSSMQIGDLVAFFFMSGLFFGPISALGNLYNQALKAMAGAERLFQLLDTPPAWSDPPQATALPPIQGEVTFQNVTFEYDPGRPVLHDVSFVAKPGQTIALVGETGSGKSTIINLTSKFYLPTQGHVLIDGHDLNWITSESLHRQMGIVLQNNFLFSGTIADNIRFARPDATDEQVIEALQKLGRLELLTPAPAGLDTHVGERGGGVSAGQRQLICFARAMLADPRILILDEATSSIDSHTEAQLQRALSVLLQGRTSFIVAHRLSTIRHADQVFLLSEGRIIERGRHDELIALGGRYAKLYQEFAKSA